MKMKYRACLLPLILAACLSLSGCGIESRAEEMAPPAAADSSEALADEMISKPAAVQISAEDSDDSWDGETAVFIAFEETAAEISGKGASFGSGVLTVSQAGTYVLSGKLKGQVLVDAGKNDIVRLVLDGVDIENESSAGIYSKKAGKTVLILNEGKKNSVADGEIYVYAEGEDEPDAAVFSKGDLSILGSGSLSVAGNFKNGIATKDSLVASNGKISVTAVNDALRGKDGIEIIGGEFDLISGNDAIKTNNGEEAGKGTISISGGVFDIISEHDGIQADTVLSISGGEFSIVTGGGAAASPPRSTGDFGRGGWGQAATAEPEEAESDSKKALKSGTLLAISGGNYLVDAEDDAFHSNGDMLVENASFEVNAGDDAFHADSSLTVNSGSVNVITCFEGLESPHIDVNGGSFTIYAIDDAINAANGEAGSFGGRGGQSSDIYLRITGGEIRTHSLGDGFDANGNIFIDGGKIYASGPSMGMQGAIDFDGAMKITGGELITAGSSLSPSLDSEQASILIGYTSSQPAGTVIALKDSSGETILEYEGLVSFTASAFSSPEIKVGEVYYLYINGEKATDITQSSIVTSISDDGGAYSQRGGWGVGGERIPGNRGDGFSRPDAGSAAPGGRAAPEGGFSLPEGGFPGGARQAAPTAPAV
ncbi:MAG: carbohydrate-binding domain-containing protein [Clostridiales bacterium]|nr:carbohydrate-binding domain-containing protein [Clostridiales bacterium]